MSSVRFAILCLGRTGSSHLVALLDSHPDARCFGEVLNLTHPKATDEGAFAHSAQSDPIAHVRELLRSRNERAVGFKLPANSIAQHPSSVELLGPAEGMRIIRLRRENPLALLVSRRLLKATLVSQSTQGSYGETTVRIAPAACVTALERIEQEQRELDALGTSQPELRISYDELVAGERQEELQRFLGLEPQPLSSPLRRLRTRPLSSTIDNWDEVSAALRPTRFAPLAGERS